MSFTVNDFQDLEQILEEHPEWRTRLRRQILSDELLALPEQASSFRTETAQRFQELAEAQIRTDEHVAGLAKQVAELAEAQQRTEERISSLTEQVEALTHVVGGLKSDVADLKGIGLENQYRTRGHAYFGRLLHRAHVLSSDEVISLLEDAAKSGMLSAIQVDEILLADIIVSGKRREDGSEVYLVVEVSWGVGVHDVERAANRATLLSQIGTPALPVVAGKWITPDAQQLAELEKAWQLANGRTVIPKYREGST
jgi:hypothetical protein